MGLRQNRDWARLFAAQVMSLVGSGVTSVALASFAYELVGRDATVVAGGADPASPEARRAGC